MRRDRVLALGSLALVALAIPTRTRADVTVIYAPAAVAAAPLVARPVPPPGDHAPPIEPPPLEEIARAPSATPELPATEPPEIARAPRATAPLDERELPPVPPPIAPLARATHETAPAEPLPVPVAALQPSPCPAPVVLVRASDGRADGRAERASIPLLRCDGAPDPESLVALSVLARPRALTAPPAARELAEHASHPELAAPGVRRLHPGLLERVRAIADRFPGHAIEIVSGFRPDARAGSRHLHGLALDLRVTGASLEELHAFVARFDRTGVGLYPTTGFVHLDVRERATRWIDESGPGEPPRVVRREDAPRGARVRAADRPASSLPSVPPTPTPPPRPTRPPDLDAPDPEAIDAAAIDADAIADEVLRGLGDLSLPRRP